MRLFGWGRKQRQRDVFAELERECSEAVAHSKQFSDLDRFLRARIAEEPERDELMTRLESMYGKCDVSGFGTAAGTTFVFCAPDNFAEMEAFARRWASHSEFRAEWIQ